MKLENVMYAQTASKPNSLFRNVFYGQERIMENVFRDGEIKTAGTDIDELMPPISRFGGGDRFKKKQLICNKGIYNQLFIDLLFRS